MLFAGAAPAAAAKSYDVSIEGAPDGLGDRLHLISELEKGVRDYPTSAALRRAAKRDVKAFTEALQAAGYYAGRAGFRLQPGDGENNPRVLFEIEPGPQFKITNYEIIYEDEAAYRPAGFDATTITPDRSAAGADLRALQLKFLNHLWETGYPAAEIVARRASANFEDGIATAIFIFKTGPKARFGEPRIEGLAKTNPEYIRKLKTWEAGEEFDRSKIVAYRDRLAKTGLFSSIRVAPGTPEEDGQAPVLVTLEERKRRSIGAGVSFSTAEGPGGRVFFDNRNLFRHGEALRIELSGTQFEQSINFGVIKPFPTLPGQGFGNLQFRNETTDAFDARSLSISGGLAKKWLDDRLETRAALSLETSKIREDGMEERTYFVSTPLTVSWNSEDDLLSPAEGFRAAWTVTPYTGTDSFTQTELSARSRIHFGGNDRFTLAGRAALGATIGSSLNGLPRNKRFYAGGGGSVRGFGFQEAGPLDADNDPIGGRSLIEGAVEARAMLSQKIQIAGFVDAGSVSAKSTPDFNEKFFIGVGGGVRYFTAIGPIRADVAFPLDKRDTDRSFQIFIAIGQPF